jgi:hypothetical protein
MPVQTGEKGGFVDPEPAESFLDFPTRRIFDFNGVLYRRVVVECHLRFGMDGEEARLGGQTGAHVAWDVAVDPVDSKWVGKCFQVELWYVFGHLDSARSSKLVVPHGEIGRHQWVQSPIEEAGR